MDFLFERAVLSNLRTKPPGYGPVNLKSFYIIDEVGKLLLSGIGTCVHVSYVHITKIV